MSLHCDPSSALAYLSTGVAFCRRSLTSAWRMQLEPLQQARMHLAIAASASAVYQTLLRLTGPSPEEQAHAKELVGPLAFMPWCSQAVFSPMYVQAVMTLTAGSARDLQEEGDQVRVREVAARA